MKKISLLEPKGQYDLNIISSPQGTKYHAREREHSPTVRWLPRNRLFYISQFENC